MLQYAFWNWHQTTVTYYTYTPTLFWETQTHSRNQAVLWGTLTSCALLTNRKSPQSSSTATIRLPGWCYCLFTFQHRCHLARRSPPSSFLRFLSFQPPRSTWVSPLTSSCLCWLSSSVWTIFFPPCAHTFVGFFVQRCHFLHGWLPKLTVYSNAKGL